VTSRFQGRAWWAAALWAVCLILAVPATATAMLATLDEAAVAVLGLLQPAPQIVGLGQAQGLTTNRCVTVNPSQPCR
jgi:hypothetical protein